MRALIVVLVFLVTACTNVDQTVSPSAVDVNVSTPPVDVGVGTTPPPDTTPVPSSPVTLVLDPPSIEGAAPSSAVVKVTALDAGGNEVQSVNLTVSGLDTNVAAVKEVDGRFVSFSLKASGVTTAIITAAGAQTVLVITVS